MNTNTALVVCAAVCLAWAPRAVVAQGMPPCGLAKLAAAGEKQETRFFPYAPELVRARLTQALHAVGMEVRKEKDGRIEAGHEGHRMLAAQGVTGVWATKKGAMGKAGIELKPGSEGNVQGTVVTVEFHKNKLMGRAGKGGWATPILDETGCLLKTLTVVDPQKQPSGPPVAAGSAAELRLPAGTEVKVRLSDVLYTKTAKPEQAIVFEVAEDVVVDGKVAIRRGALGTGRFERFSKRKNYGGAAEIEFVVDGVTAVDGQRIAVSSESDVRGKAKRQVGQMALAGGAGLLAGAFAKGNHTQVRAGTEYSAFTTTEQVVAPGRPVASQ